MHNHITANPFLRLTACLVLFASACGSAGYSLPETIGATATTPPASKQQQPAKPNPVIPDTPTTAPSATSPAADCTPAENITASDVGTALCATGTVRRTWQDAQASYLDFGSAFYLVSYDLDLTVIQHGTCLMVSNTVKQLASHPIMVVPHTAPPTDCRGQALPLGRNIPPAGKVPGKTPATASPDTADTTATETPGPTATTPPTPTTPPPTATPTQEPPTPTPPTPLAITLVSLTSPVGAGAYASLVIHYAPGAGCFLSYVTPHGTLSVAKGLGGTTADGNGNCGWSWKIGTNTYAGTGHLSVSVNNGQASAGYDIVIQ
jgi:hypothetical protein